MTRICITINFFPIAGGARAIAYEVWRTLHNEYEVHFLTIPPKTYHKQYIIHPLQRSRRFYFPFNPGLFPFNIGYVIFGFLKLLYLNKKYHFNVILSQDGVFTGLYSVLFGKITGTKVVVMDYGATTNYLSSEYWNFQNATATKGLGSMRSLHTMLIRATARIAIQLTARMADRFGVLGHELSKIYQNLRVDNFKLRTIQYSVDEDFFKPSEAKKTEGRRRLGILNNSIVVNATCRLSQEKGVEYLLPAFKQAIRQNNRIVCLLVGKGNMAEFAAEFVKQNWLENRIILMGEASPEKVRDLLQLSDVFVYAGVSGSNVSLAVLEAMAVRLAVIAADSPLSHRDLLANNRGIAVPTKDISALAKAISLLSENDRLRKEMAENGRRWVLEHHSLKVTKANIEALVRT